MKSVVLAFIKSFGRFGVLLLFAASLAAVTLWLDLLDGHFGWFVLLAPPVIGSALATGALLVGMLFAAPHFPKLRYVSRAEAPGLWCLLDEAAQCHPIKTWHLAIDDEFNASVRRHRRLLRPFAREAIVTFGLPYLATLDEQAVAAVLAHEVEHDRRQHTTGALNISEFEQTFETLFLQFPPHRTLTGAVTYALLGRTGQWLADEQLARSRRNEFEADDALVSETGRQQMARALLLTHAISEFASREIYDPLNLELLGAMRVPSSPLFRLLDCRDELRQPEVLTEFAKIAYAKPPDPKSSHPSLAERLTSLGATELPTSPVLGSFADATLLSPELRSDLVASFDKRWTARMADHIERT